MEGLITTEECYVNLLQLYTNKKLSIQPLQINQIVTNDNVYIIINSGNVGMMEDSTHIVHDIDTNNQ